MHHHGMASMSTVPEVDRHRMQLSPKARKMSSTGGNRSWSEEEEQYLLQTRMQKMPYKHIAAHLKKTELACRLHYHQLSHGSHRRKRTNSLSSSHSGSSNGSQNLSPNTSPFQLLPDQGDYGHLNKHGQTSPNGFGAMGPEVQYNMNGSPGRVHHKLLLPKPRPLTPPDTNEPFHGLRINTGAPMMHQSSVDTDRLRAIYDSHRANFWSTIAAEYGTDVSPTQLEQIWRHGGMTIRPPTPDDSPNGKINSHLMPSPFPPFHGALSATERKDYSPLHCQVSSAVSAPDKFGFCLPTPNPSTCASTPSAGRLSRSSTWSSASASLPSTSIQALLTENKCPRRTDYCVGGHC